MIILYLQIAKACEILSDTVKNIVAWATIRRVFEFPTN